MILSCDFRKIEVIQKKGTLITVKLTFLAIWIMLLFRYCFTRSLNENTKQDSRLIAFTKLYICNETVDSPTYFYVIRSQTALTIIAQALTLVFLVVTVIVIFKKRIGEYFFVSYTCTNRSTSGSNLNLKKVLRIKMISRFLPVIIFSFATSHSKVFLKNCDNKSKKSF